METHSYPNYGNNTLLFPEQPLHYASFGERLGAAFIDGLVLLVPNYFFRFAFGPGGIILSMALSWIYFAWQESNSGATLGKKAVGLQVKDANGENISFGQASARHFSKYLSMLTIFIGYFMMLWDNKSQTLHDKIANTLIVKE